MDYYYFLFYFVNIVYKCGLLRGRGCRTDLSPSNSERGAQLQICFICVALLSSIGMYDVLPARQAGRMGGLEHIRSNFLV